MVAAICFDDGPPARCSSMSVRNRRDHIRRGLLKAVNGSLHRRLHHQRVLLQQA